MKNNDLIQNIEKVYPFPIAATYRKLRVIDEDEIVSKHDSYGDLFETLIKFLAILALQDLRQNEKIPGHFDQFLKNMLHPSLGHWNEILRLCVSESNKETVVTDKIKNFFDNKLDDSIRQSLEFIKETLKTKFTIKQNRDIFNLLILYRNKVWKGHGSKISKEEYKKRMDVLHSVLLYLMGEIEFITEYDLIYIDEINVIPTGEFKHKIKLGKGSQIEPDSFILSSALKPNHVYLISKDQEKNTCIDLHPLLVSYSCPDCKSHQFYYFNDYRNNRLEYLSYACGHFIYPDMLPSEVEQFLNISLTTIKVTDTSFDKLEEGEQVNELIKNSKIKISSKEYYEAIELLQISETKKSTWEANYYLALLKMAASFSLFEITYHIKTCLSMEEGKTEADTLFKFLEEEFADEEQLKSPSQAQIEKLANFAREILNKEVYTPVAKTLYHHLCPPLFRNSTLYFWIFVPIMLIVIRGYLSHYLGWPYSIAELILKSSFFVFFIPIVYYISNGMSQIYFSLNQQLTENAKEYFPEWFQNQIDNIFGKFTEENSFRSRLNLKSKTNRNYALLVISLFILAFPGSILLTCYGSRDMNYILLQTFDFAVIWIVCVPGAPIVLRTFLMLRNYVTFSIKPLISMMDSVSLRKIGRIIFIVSVPWTSLGFCFTVLGYLSFSKDIILIQLALFYFLIFLGITWTVLTPFYFSKSLGKAKNKIVVRYGHHIEENFNAFLNNPDNKNLERHKWLINAQDEILKIKTTIISKGDFIGILGINVFILAIGILYPFVKWNISFSDLIEWFQSVFIL